MPNEFFWKSEIIIIGDTKRTENRAIVVAVNVFFLICHAVKNMGIATIVGTIVSNILTTDTVADFISMPVRAFAS